MIEHESVVSPVETSGIVWEMSIRKVCACARIVLFTMIAVVHTAAESSASPKLYPIYVKILVDEEEPTSSSEWQRRLGERVRQASGVISKYCDLRFVPYRFATWKSDDRINDFGRSLREFESEVSYDPAQIAIGFSSQYRFQSGRNSAGGTRGPLNPHILIREGARSIHEPDRIEVLVHELCHFLGAAHCADQNSVMRTTLGDGRVRSKSFSIRLDSDNARVVRLVGREVRDLRVRQFNQLTPATRTELRRHYVNLQHGLPSDKTAERYIQLIDRTLDLGLQEYKRRKAVTGPAIRIEPP